MVAKYNKNTIGVISEPFFKKKMSADFQRELIEKLVRTMNSGKKSKKKWSKKAHKDKAQHAVILDQEKYDRILKEVPTYRYISVSVLVDRLKLGGSLIILFLTLKLVPIRA